MSSKVIVSAVVEGYATPTSVVAGETVAIHCSATVPEVAIEIVRVGARREVVWQRDRLAVAEHAIPDDASANGCRWPVTLTVTVEQTWSSGFYEVVFRAPQAILRAHRAGVVLVRNEAEPPRVRQEAGENRVDAEE